LERVSIFIKFINLFNNLILNEFSSDKTKLVENSKYYYNIIKINEILNNKNNCYYHVFKELVNRQNQMIKKKMRNIYINIIIILILKK
jgi:hypothetical protein